MTSPRRLLIGTAAALALTACGTSSSGASYTPTSLPSTTTQPKVTTTATKVLVVIEENHTRAEMHAGMPYLARLSHQYGYATRWKSLTHPSEPNYLGIAGGSLFGVTNDHPPSVNARRVGRAESVFSQAIRAGRTATTYAQAMPRRCQTSDAYPYAVKHNPWAFFRAQRGMCRRHDVNASAFVRDARANQLPNVGFLIPDLQHDAHDGTLARADAWLRKELTPVLASSDFTSGRLVVVVTADEDDHTGGNVVLTSVLTPALHHVVVRRPLTHYSLTRYIAQVLGVRPLRGGRHAPDLARAFGL